MAKPKAILTSPETPTLQVQAETQELEGGAAGLALPEENSSALPSRDSPLPSVHEACPSSSSKGEMLAGPSPSLRQRKKDERRSVNNQDR